MHTIGSPLHYTWTLGIALVALAPACGDDGGTASSGPAQSSTTEDPGTTAASSTTQSLATDTDPSATTTGVTSTGADTTTGSGPGPAYPPCGEGMTCPGDEECAGFGGAGEVCMPPCGAEDACPEAEGGTATPFCGVNTSSSQAACTMAGTSDECPVMEEVCQMTGAGELACLLPPSHCILLCGAMFGDCPEGMECSTAGVCQWVP